MPRPKAFDPADKLDEAMALFWKEGFESTSIPKLEKELKINRFSIYDTYGDKRTLFIKVLKRFTEILVKHFVEPLEGGSQGIADLQQFFAKYRQKFGKPGQAMGCLLCNTAGEIGNRDPGIAEIVNAYFERVGDAFFASLLRARDLGEIEGSDAELRAYARLLRTGVQGILVESRQVDDARVLKPAFDALDDYIRRLGTI